MLVQHDIGQAVAYGIEARKIEARAQINTV